MAGALGAAVMVSSALADPPANRLLDRARYADHLRAMWQAEVVANWTGVRTEGMRQGPPFFTDADWGTRPPDMLPWQDSIRYVTEFDPWWADDDTDIEYLYLHTLHTRSANRASPEWISADWLAHIHDYVWVSNATARQLMTRYIVPPMTAAAQGMVSQVQFTSDSSLMIDAQLTTEFFGALCPGMPDRALAMADLPIRTTSVGYATHASQFYVVLYSLASQVDRTLSPEQQSLWLVREARKYIPDSSKAADVVDFVLADYLANPDKNDWESTRDKVYQRYQAGTPGNGFVFRAWYESTVNFATGLMALLYGEMDYLKTVRIGTLSGWDSDNGTATMGGLIGLVQGPAWRPAAPMEWMYVSDRYWISRTRDSMPDYTPADPGGEDTFTLMAQRMLPIIDREVAAAGGRVSGAGSSPPSGLWLLPPGGAGAGVTTDLALAHSPTHRLMLASANNAVARAGGAVASASSVPGLPEAWWYGSGDPAYMANGYEHDFRGGEDYPGRRAFYSTQRAGGNSPAVPQTLTVSYDRPVTVRTIRFIAGDIWLTGSVTGGWFAAITPEVFSGGVWIAPAMSSAAAPDPTRPFQILDFVLAEPVQATAIRVRGAPGGSGGFVTCAELDALSEAWVFDQDLPVPPPSGLPQPPSADLNGDGHVDVEDLWAFFASPVPAARKDLNVDGSANLVDVRYLEALVRFGELPEMSAGRR